MLYNIFLDNFIANSDNETFQEGYILLQKLACENADFVRSKTFPVIICRYATESDVKFYEELAKKYYWAISHKEITSNQNAFQIFDEEIVQKEQGDLHLMSKPDVIDALDNGLSVLEDKENALSDFTDAQDVSKSVIASYYENIAIKYKAISIYPVFIIWIMISALLCISSLYSWGDKIFIASCIFCVLIPGSLIYDFIVYKKNKKHYLSKEYFNDVITSLCSSYKKKNNSIHDVEEFIDSLTARNCLVLLPFDKRNSSSIEHYLRELSTNKSIDEIFSLH